MFTLGQKVSFPFIQLFGLPYKQDDRHVGKVLKIEHSPLGDLHTVKILDTGAIKVPLKYYASQLTLTEEDVVLSSDEQSLLDESLGV